MFCSVKPGAPSGRVRASSITPESVTLTWQPPVDDGGAPLKKYIIEAKEETGDWSPLAEVSPKSTTKTLSDLQEGKEYQFRVVAENEVGRGKDTKLDESIVPIRLPGEFCVSILKFCHVMK